MERTLKNQKSVSENICNDLLIKIDKSKLDQDLDNYFKSS
jgi:hypothetical protein